MSKVFYARKMKALGRRQEKEAKQHAAAVKKLEAAARSKARGVPGNALTRMDLSQAALTPSLSAAIRLRLLAFNFEDESARIKARNACYRVAAGVCFSRELNKILDVAEDGRNEYAASAADELYFWLRSSPDVCRVRRALYDMLGDLRLKHEKYATYWAVPAVDLRRMYLKLTPKDKLKIKSTARTMEFAPPLSVSSAEHVFTAVILPTAKKIASRKVSFIAKHDHGQTLADFTIELAEEGMRTLRIYDWMSSEYKLINYVKRCMHNYVIDIIKRETAPERSRLRHVDSHARVYESTVLSLDRMLGPDEDNPAMYDFLRSEEAENDQRAANARATLRSAMSHMGDNVQRAFELGMQLSESAEFDSWLRAAGEDPKKLGVVQRTKMACRFVGCSWTWVKHEMGAAIAASPF